MNDEIKEILKDLEYASGVFDYTITPDKCTLLLDYITNLQEQLHQASLDIQELTERDLYCPTNCDKLTNLQKENQNLKRMCELYGEYLYNADLKKYKSIIDKTIEYISDNTDEKVITMNNEELIKKEIEGLKWVIDSIKSRNEDSDELSFLYYQLHELEKELQQK